MRSFEAMNTQSHADDYLWRIANLVMLLMVMLMVGFFVAY